MSTRICTPVFQFGVLICITHEPNLIYTVYTKFHFLINIGVGSAKQLWMLDDRHMTVGRAAVAWQENRLHNTGLYHRHEHTVHQKQSTELTNMSA